MTMRKYVIRIVMIVPLTVLVCVAQQVDERAKRDPLADGMRFLLEQVGRVSEPGFDLATSAETYREHFGLNSTDFAVLLQEAMSLRSRDRQRETQANAIPAAGRGISAEVRSNLFTEIRLAREQDVRDTGDLVLRAMSPEGADQLRLVFARNERLRPQRSVVGATGKP